MTDEDELIHDLIRLAATYRPNTIAYVTIHQALKRLKPSPVPPDAIEVRIAVAVNEHGSVALRMIETKDSPSGIICDAEMAVTHPFRDIEITHRGIGVLHIPRRVVPIVEGKAEVPK